MTTDDKRYGEIQGKDRVLVLVSLWTESDQISCMLVAQIYMLKSNFTRKKNIST